MSNRLKSEATEQENVISWCFYREPLYPELKWIHHCPNGGNRKEMEARRLKAQGVKPGVPDLHLPIAKGKYIGLYIEMKYDKGKIQKSQEEWIDGMAAAGHYACVCYGFDTAIKVIEMYVQLLPGQEMKLENGVILK